MLHHHVLLLRHPEWHNIFDSDKAQGAATRRRVLETMSADGTQCVLYHFPFPGVGRFVRAGQGFAWIPMPMHEG